METALRYELIKAIPELKDVIYPTNAPESLSKTYLVYTRISTKKIKTFEGHSKNQSLSFMFSIVATKYSEMVDVRKKVEELLVSLPLTEIGMTNIKIEDLTINNISETYEFNLKKNRGIIDFTIHY